MLFFYFTTAPVKIQRVNRGVQCSVDLPRKVFGQDRSDDRAETIADDRRGTDTDIYRSPVFFYWSSESAGSDDCGKSKRHPDSPGVSNTSCKLLFPVSLYIYM